MNTFLSNLLSCSAVMSAAFLVLAAVSAVLGRHYSPKWRRITYLAVLAGFLLPIRVSLKTEPYAVTVALPAAQTADSAASMTAVLFAVWAAGFIVSLALTAAKHMRLTSMLSRCSKPCSLGMADGLSKVCICEAIPSPMLVGLFRPTIYLPSLPEDDEALRMILLHEQTHLRSGDLVVCFAAALCRALHWFNPLAYALTSALNRACEAACDSVVVASRSHDERKRYCGAIIASVRVNESGVSPLTTCFSPDRASLKRRLAEILSTKRRRSFALLALIAIAASVFAGSALAFSVEDGSFGQSADAQTTTATYTSETDYAAQAGESGTLHVQINSPSAVASTPMLHFPTSSEQIGDNSRN